MSGQFNIRMFRLCEIDSVFQFQVIEIPWYSMRTTIIAFSLRTANDAEVFLI